MTLLKRLEDSEEGLVGITEEDERVHLGIPKPYSNIHNFKARGKSPSKDLRDFEQSLREDKDAFWYFDKDNVTCVCPISVDYHSKYTYIRFEKAKEEAFRLNSDVYLEGPSHEQRAVKIHRIQE